MDISSWLPHFKKIVKEHKSCEALEQLDPSPIGKAIIEIAVFTDGSWHKSGHVSLYGIVMIIEILSSLALWLTLRFFLSFVKCLKSVPLNLVKTLLSSRYGRLDM